MHEFSMATRIVETVLQTAKMQKALRVKEVRLLIGALSFLNAEQVKFAYKILSEGTLLENSELIIEEKEAKVRCERCGYEGPISNIEDPLYHFFIPSLLCPKCGGTSSIIEGKECILESVKMEK
jgi:hydrogenase nickel incorporation protein HypA/HybF